MKQCRQNCRFCELILHNNILCKNELAIIAYSEYYCRINYKDNKDLQDDNILIQKELCESDKNCPYYEDKYEWDKKQQEIMQKQIEEEEKKKQEEISYWEDYYSKHEWWEDTTDSNNVIDMKNYLDK